jgi:hypothetical protein
MFQIPTLFPGQMISPRRTPAVQTRLECPKPRPAALRARLRLRPARRTPTRRRTSHTNEVFLAGLRRRWQWPNSSRRLAKADSESREAKGQGRKGGQGILGVQRGNPCKIGGGGTPRKRDVVPLKSLPSYSSLSSLQGPPALFTAVSPIPSDQTQS